MGIRHDHISECFHSWSRASVEAIKIQEADWKSGRGESVKPVGRNNERLSKKSDSLLGVPPLPSVSNGNQPYAITTV